MSLSSDMSIAQKIDPLIAEHCDQKGGLLPLLHAVQEAIGYIPAESVLTIAQAFNLSRAEVHGVITYYHFFRSKPAGRHVIQVCRAEACQSCGGEALLAHAEKVLGCKSHETRADGRVTLEAVYCLGLCASSPALQINDTLYARMTPAKLEAVLAELEAAS